MPSVLVVTPTYNRLQSLIEAIQSVKKQTYQDFMHLIVSDGCTDGTNQFLWGAWNQDPKIRALILTENTGVKAFATGTIARSKGIDYALKNIEGIKYIAYVDDDCLMHPTHLETLVCCIESNKLDFSWNPIQRASLDGRIKDVIGVVEKPALGKIDTNCLMHTVDIYHRSRGWLVTRRWKRADDFSLVDRMMKAGGKYKRASNSPLCTYRFQNRPGGWLSGVIARFKPAKYDE